MQIHGNNQTYFAYWKKKRQAPWETEVRTVERQENETRMLALMGVFFCDIFSSSIITGVRK